MSLGQKLDFSGYLDRDTDPTKLDPGNYSDGKNLQFLTGNTESTRSHIPMRGNTEAFSLGTTVSQNKTWRITSPQDATNDVGGIFLYDQNGNLFPTIGGQAQPMEWNRNQTLASQRTDILAMFTTIDGSGNTVITTSGNDIFITTDTVNGYDIGLKATTRTAPGVLVTDTSLDPQIYQEAYDESVAGENHAIGSFDLLGDLYVWSTAQTHLPTVITPTITTVADNGSGRYRITTSAAHGLTTGWKVAVSGVNITTPGIVSPNGLWIITVISATIFDVQEWYVITTGFVQGAAGGSVTIYTQGVGIIGVAQFDADAEAWGYIQIARTIQWNFTTKKQIDTYAERNAVKDSIYWTDDFNVPRVIYYIKEYDSNGGLLPFETDGIITIINDTGLYSYVTINEESRLQLSSTDAFVDFLEQIQAGGGLNPGNWRYAVRFLTSSLTTTVPTDLTNPINVYAADFNGDPHLIIGNAPGDATSKINRLEVTGILPGLFQYVELIAVNYVGDGVVGYVVSRTLLSNTQTSIILNHTGTETGVINFDLGLLNQQFADISTAKNIDVIDKRMILSNLTTGQVKDFSAWAESIAYKLFRTQLTAVRSSVNGTLVAGEYQDPENVNHSLGYMHNETYRFGVKLRMKTGGWTQGFWVDDIKIDCTAGGRKIVALTDFNLTDNTSGGADNILYSAFVSFIIGNAELDYLIDGTKLRDLVDAISFVRAEVNPTILACGVGILGVSGTDTGFFDDGYSLESGFDAGGSADTYKLSANTSFTDADPNKIMEFPWASGRTTVLGLGQNPLYSSYPGPTVADQYDQRREYAAFYASDIWFNHTSIAWISGDKIINFGNPAFYAFNNGYATGSNRGYSNYTEYTGRTNKNAANPPVQVTLDGAAFILKGGSAVLPLAGTQTFYKVVRIEQTSTNAAATADNSTGLVLLNDSAPVFDNVPGFVTPPDHGIYYMQYYRALVDQYGNTNLTEYVTIGHLLEINANTGPSSQNVFGGDTFTQANYFKHRYSDTLLNGLAGGLLFYSQNRVNAQMKQKSPSQVADLYPAVPTAAWLETPTNTDGSQGEAYQEGYTARNEVQSILAFDPNLEDTNDFPARIMWSDIKAQGSPSDSYRNFLPLNFHDLDQTFGEIMHHANANGELITWQQRAFMRQYFNTRGTLEVKGITEILIGDGSVMSRDGVTVSRLGCKHKWAIIKGKSDGGNDTFYWINTELKKALRFGYDGTVSIADIKGMRAFFANNLKWADKYDTPADGWGICGYWDDRYSNAGWSVRARRTTPYTYDAVTNFTNIGRLVYYEPAVFSTFEKTGELFLLKFVNGPATVVVTPVAVYPVPLLVATITGTTLLTITTGNFHLLVTGDQVMFRFVDGLSGNINNVFHTVIVTGVDTFTITVSALQNNYVVDSGSIVAVNPKYWTFLPHTDSDYWNEYSILFNEVKNAFTFFTTPKPKIYLKWTNTFLSPRPISPEYKVYEHDKGDYLTWYLDSGLSQQERGFIEGVMNEADSEIKWSEALAVDSLVAPVLVEFRNTSQESFLLESEFTERERNFYSPVKQDSTGIGVNDAGTSRLYDEWMSIKMYFEINIYQELRDIIIKFRTSARLKGR